MYEHNDKSSTCKLISRKMHALGIYFLEYRVQLHNSRCFSILSFERGNKPVRQRSPMPLSRGPGNWTSSPGSPRVHCCSFYWHSAHYSENTSAYIIALVNQINIFWNLNFLLKFHLSENNIIHISTCTTMWHNTWCIACEICLPFNKLKDRSLSPLANLARGTIISHHWYPQATVHEYVHFSRSTCYPQAKEYEHYFSMYVLWVWEILDNCRVCRWRGFPRTEGRTAAESVSVHPGKMQPPRTACSATLHALVHMCMQTGWSLYTVSVNKKYLY